MEKANRKEQIDKKQTRKQVWSGKATECKKSNSPRPPLFYPRPVVHSSAPPQLNVEKLEKYGREIQLRNTVEKYRREIQSRNTVEKYSREIQSRNTVEKYS